MLVGALAGDDLVDQLHTASAADAARRALAARFDGAELHREASLTQHVDRVVEDHHAAVAQQRTGGSEGLVVDGQVELVWRQVRTQRAAHLHRANRATAGGTAAELLDQLAHGDAERCFEDAATRHVACHLHHLGTAAAAEADGRIGGRPVGQDGGQCSEAEHVVDDRRLAPQALDGRQRRLGTHDAALALDALHQCRLLAADVRAGAHTHVQPEATCMASMASGYSLRMYT